jgi:SWI/SNF related-matrix-associated actin-dependent regulator of chromatin subfamily C
MATTTTTAMTTTPATHPHPPPAAKSAPSPPSTTGVVKSEAPPTLTSSGAGAAAAGTGSGAEDPSYTITVPSYSGKGTPESRTRHPRHCCALLLGKLKPRTLTGIPLAAWFSYDSIHDTERRLLPDFFEGEAAAASGSRGPDAYKYYRNTLVRMFRSRPGRRLTLTEARRGLVGDVGSIRRVFDFLEEWGLINYGALPSGSKQAKEKREEAAQQALLPAGATAPKKLCTRCRTVCGLAYFICEKVIALHMVLI